MPTGRGRSRYVPRSLRRRRRAPLEPSASRGRGERDESRAAAAVDSTTALRTVSDGNPFPGTSAVRPCGRPGRRCRRPDGRPRTALSTNGARKTVTVARRRLTETAVSYRLRPVPTTVSFENLDSSSAPYTFRKRLLQDRNVNRYDVPTVMRRRQNCFKNGVDVL